MQGHRIQEKEGNIQMAYGDSFQDLFHHVGCIPFAVKSPLHNPAEKKQHADFINIYIYAFTLHSQPDCQFVNLLLGGGILKNK